jgi:rubrerythrin
MATLPAGYPPQAFEAFDFLKNRQPLSVTDLQVLALIEGFGEVFYEGLAGSVDGEAAALLRRNGQEERGHAHRVLKAIEIKGGAPFTLPAAAENPFVKVAPSYLASEEFLGMLAAAEVDGERIYLGWAESEPDPEVAKLLRQNGREEMRHSERVAQARQLLLAGTAR